MLMEISDVYYMSIAIPVAIAPVLLLTGIGFVLGVIAWAT
jgi:hypothetical protein